MALSRVVAEEFPGSVPGTVKFSDRICCALKRAFKLNPSIVQELGQVAGGDMKLFTEILENTEEPKFVPSEEMKIIYSQIAKREIERIVLEGEGDEDLYCGHGYMDHWHALEKVLDQLEPTAH